MIQHLAQILVKLVGYYSRFDGFSMYILDMKSQRNRCENVRYFTSQFVNSEFQCTSDVGIEIRIVN